MGKRLLVRSKAGDHVAQSEKEVLQWLKDGHCECGDPVYSEASKSWSTVSDLEAVGKLFQEKPKSKREKPVITVYRLGTGKSLQAGPFTLSAVLDMIRQGTLSAASWIFVEGDSEWRQVKAVKILRQALPELPKAAPDFNNLSAGSGAAAARAPEISVADSLLGGNDLPNADDEPTPPHGTPVPDNSAAPEGTQTNKILGYQESENQPTSFVPIPHNSPQILTRTHSVQVDEDELIPDGATESVDSSEISIEVATREVDSAPESETEEDSASDGPPSAIPTGPPTAPTFAPIPHDSPQVETTAHPVVPDSAEEPTLNPAVPPAPPEADTSVPDVSSAGSPPTPPGEASFAPIPHDSPQVETAAHEAAPDIGSDPIADPSGLPPEMMANEPAPEDASMDISVPNLDGPPAVADSASGEFADDAFLPDPDAARNAYEEAMAEDGEISVRLDNTGINFKIPDEQQNDLDDSPASDGPIVSESPVNMAGDGTNANSAVLESAGFTSIPNLNGDGAGAPPAPPGSSEPPQVSPAGNEAPPPPPVTESLASDEPVDDGVDRIPPEEQTMAFSALGLSALKEEAPSGMGAAAPPPAPAPPTPSGAPPAPPIAPSASSAPAAPPASAAAGVSQGSTAEAGEKTVKEDYDGITVEISPDPIWQVKQENSGRLSGPFTFQEVLDMLQSGRLGPDDKITKVGSNRFNKISQQYEFNVKHSVETVIENGVERQKILIKRRHPRVAYITDAQVNLHGRGFHAKCVNISAGGVLLEASDLDVSLGDQIELTLMPGAIAKQIQSTALVIGKIPKKPPGFALKFVNLSVEDKEAIQFYVMEALKREQAMGM